VFYLQAAVFVHSLALIRPRLRPLWYRAAISIPSAFFSAGTLFALPWAVVVALRWDLPFAWLPYLVAMIGVVQSLTTREEELDLVVDGSPIPGLRRTARGLAQVARPLSIIQITDPHLGPFMSVERLRSIAESAAQRDPDLVVLTGDFLTMESQSDPAFLARALEPLQVLPGRVFACLGNHDHEALSTVKSALQHAGATLLVDESALVPTPAGLVQIVGYDFHFRDRAAQLARVSARNPRVPGALRLVLLHDPGAFRHLPEGEADLVLSGHTHGGQIGLVSLGLPWTLLRLFWKGPDHGFWARGVDRLYVHRGTGHYGFPLRVGVPAENSLVRVHAPRAFAVPGAAE
jgi:predicted MPP superfamily phosphohydrolase